MPPKVLLSRTLPYSAVKDTVERTLPYWEGAITPALKRGKTVLVAAHGNSIRGMLKALDGISDAEVVSLESKHGQPPHCGTRSVARFMLALQRPQHLVRVCALACVTTL